MTKGFDSFGFVYDLGTQRKVSLYLAAPAAITAVAMGTNLNSLSGYTILGVPLVVLLGWIALPIVHDNGKAYMRRLVAKRGLPSTQALQLRTNSGYQVETRRERIEEVTGVKLADKDAEINDPADADQRIYDATEKLRGKFRGHPKAVVLRRVLKYYGFWRNMVGNRWIGILISLASAAAATFGQWYLGPTWPQFLAALIGLATALAWTFYITDERFITVSKRYSDELFASMTLLP